MRAGEVVGPPARPRRVGRHPRGATVVRSVLGAALDELARVGYAALTIDQVAARARVNKTTVYRRWPTKADLVGAACAAAADEAPPLPETSDVRDGLLAVARRMGAFMSSPRGRGLLRLVLAGCPDPELMALASASRGRFEGPALRLLQGAIRRGQLRADLEPRAVLDLMAGWMLHRIFRQCAPVNDAALERLVDLLLRGMRPDVAPRSRPEGVSPERRVQALWKGGRP